MVRVLLVILLSFSLLACGASSDKEERLEALRADPALVLLDFDVLVHGATTDQRFLVAEAATTDDELGGLWQRAGLPSNGVPDVDMAVNVVLYFADVESSTCRADEVVAVALNTNTMRVYPAVSHQGGGGDCTADAIPWAYAVSVPRSELPTVPFTVWFGPGDGPACCTDNIIEVDLSS